MSSAIVTQSEANQWSKLLYETRLALSTLRDKELDELAARAQCMLIATFGEDSIRQRMPSPDSRDLVEVKKEHRLLSHLLAATEKNLEVLYRTLRYGPSPAGEANSKWER